MGHLLLAFVTIVFCVLGNLEAASVYFLKPVCPTPGFLQARWFHVAWTFTTSFDQRIKRHSGNSWHGCLLLPGTVAVAGAVFVARYSRPARVSLQMEGTESFCPFWHTAVTLQKLKKRTRPSVATKEKFSTNVTFLSLIEPCTSPQL